jgi:hypothetical protein
MYQNSVMAYALRRLELARRALGHNSVLLDEELYDLLHLELGGAGPIQVLNRYSELEDKAVDRLVESGGPTHRVVRPRIDLRALTLVYPGRDMVLKIRPRRGRGGIFEIESLALDVTNSNLAVVAVLSHHLAADVRMEPLDGVPDPAQHARQLLRMMVGYGEAEQMLAAYYPDWWSWRRHYSRLAGAAN